MSPHSPHKPGQIPPPPQPPPKPGVKLVRDMLEDVIELRIKPGTDVAMYVAWLASDEQRDAYAAWLEARFA